MAMSENYGVMVLKLEFWLSVILFVGGGALIWQDKSLVTPIFALFGVMITFWFNRRSSETTASNLMTAMQTQPPIMLQPTVIPQQPTEIPITEHPAQPNAPTQMGDKTNA